VAKVIGEEACGDKEDGEREPLARGGGAKAGRRNDFLPGMRLGVSERLADDGLLEEAKLATSGLGVLFEGSKEACIQIGETFFNAAAQRERIARGLESREKVRKGESNDSDQRQRQQRNRCTRAPTASDHGDQDQRKREP